MQAILRPMRSKHEAQVVELLARTGRDRIKVQLTTGQKQIFAVDRFRLFSLADRRANVPASVLNALRWGGAGPDPLLPAHAAATPHAELLGTGDL